METCELFLNQEKTSKAFGGEWFNQIVEMSAFTTCINISWDGCCCCCCLVAQLCLTLCYPIDCSPPGSSVHGWSQSRGQLQLIRQKESRVWVRNLWKVRADINTWENFTCVLSCFSHVQLFATQWTIARQALLSVGFSRHEYWSGLPCPSPGDLPNQWSNPGVPAMQIDSLPFELSWKQCQY